MNYVLHLEIPEDSAEGLAIACMMAEGHLTPEQAARVLLSRSVQPTPGKRVSALGKYAFVAGGSERFAENKRAEISLEDRPRW
jgi:hypothetical protein